MSVELTAITKLRHAALWELAKRFGNQHVAAEQCFVTMSAFSNWTTLKAAFPSWAERRGWWRGDARWTRTKEALESLTGQTIEQLWPESLLSVIKMRKMITTVEQIIEVPEEALLVYAEETTDRFRLPSPVADAEQSELRWAIRDAMQTLPPREQKVLTLRHGLEGEPVHTLRDAAAIIGVSYERVRQLEARAHRRLENPSVAKKLVGFLD